eukprot:766778-Hanusia_phi.AAC.3
MIKPPDPSSTLCERTETEDLPSTRCGTTSRSHRFFSLAVLDHVLEPLAQRRITFKIERCVVTTLCSRMCR